MPSRRQKLPNVSGGSEPELEISQSDWSRIESAYGHSLSKQIRAELHAATQEYLYWGSLESGAGPAYDAETRIDAVAKAAESFWKILLTGPKGLHPDAVFFANHLVTKNFEDSRLGKSPGDKRHFLIGLMTSFTTACKLAKDELRSESWGAWVKGESWATWVDRLASILDVNDLPTGVGKGEAGASRFVVLVRELQHCLPVEYRRHTQSERASEQGALDGALAQGIYRARPHKGT